MIYKIRFRPTFATLFVTLSPDESIVAEVGTMISMDSGIAVKKKLAGGFISALLIRLFGKRSVFVNVYTNKSSDPQSLVLSQKRLGDIERIDLKRGGICLQPSAYLAHTSEVKMGLSWGGLGSFLGGEGLFKLKFRGKGRVFMGADGGITKKVLYRDFIVDNGHLLAYEPSIRLQPRNRGQRMINYLKGKGIIYLQSRKSENLSSYLRKKS